VVRAARSLIAVAAAALVVAGCARTLRRMDRLRAGASLAYDLAYTRPVDREAAPSPPPVDGVVEGGIRLRGFGGPRALGYGIGLDVAGGVSHPLGFAWRTALYPVGVGRRLGRHGMFGLLAGVAGTGVAGRLDAAFEIPVELYLHLRAGKHAGLTAFARTGWQYGADRRQHGARDLDHAGLDVLRLGLTVRVGRNYHKWRMFSGNGYHLGVIASEDAHQRWLGVTFGYDADLATEQ